MADERDIDLGVTVRGFTPGQKVFDRYVLVRFLGRGGMGVVWLAQDEQLKREIALKFLPELVAADPTSIDDLKRETSRSLELTHPHIVRVHDFVTDGALAAISMEFVPGRTLAEMRLQQPSRVFETFELTEWMGELCEALTYAHVDASVVHRDLKPSNLMIDGRRRLKVTDFGIAATVSDTVTRVSRLTSSGGTPAYASPQQLMGEAPSPSDDIYAVGATLFELLTSKPPFYSGNLLMQVQTRRPPALAARRAELRMTGAPIPPEWEAAVAACLAKQREERPASISELAQRLGLSGAATAPAKRADEVGLDLTVVSFAPTKDVTTNRTPDSGKGNFATAEESNVPPPPPPPPPDPSAKKPDPKQSRRQASTSPSPEPISNRAPEAAVAAAPVRRSGVGKWVFATILLVAAGIGVWLGDVPNRVLALLEQRKGHQSLLTSDWTGALDHFKQAVMRRPMDPAVRSDFEKAQEQWVENVRDELTRRSPQDAFTALTPELLATGKTLTGRHADEFRELVEKSSEEVRKELRQALVRVETLAGAGDFKAAYTELEALKSRAGEMPEYAPSMQRVRETEVRHAIEAAVKQADSGNYAGALASLDQAAQSGLLSADIDDARTLVRQRAATGNVDRLGQAIRSGRVEEVRAILAASGNVTGDAASIARSLVEAKKFDAFLEAVRTAGYDQPDGAKANHSAHILAETLRDRFDDRSAVARYLAGSYTAWARDLLAAQQPGFALYALERAQVEGGTVDAEAQMEARAAAVEALDFTVLLAPTVQASREAPVPVEEVRSAAREIIERAVGSWINIVELRPVGERRTPLELRTRIGAVEMQDQTTEKADRARYQSGSETVRNPEYDKMMADYNQAQTEAANLEQKFQQMQQGGTNDVVNVLQGIVAIQLKSRAEAARRRANELHQKLAQTPQTVRNPIYEYENYRIIAHNLSYSTSLTLTLHRGADELAPWTVFDADYPHQTQEVTGNSARGVPVQKPDFPALNDVAKSLGASLGQKVRADPEGLLDAVETATFSALDNQLTAENASAAVVADRRWALARLWRLSGLAVRQTGELERAVRVQMGLPPARIETPALPPPTVVSFTETVGKGANPPPSVVIAERDGGPATGPVVAPETLIYKVRAGDTAAKIAARFEVTVAALRTANPRVDLRRLSRGQELVIPRD